MPEAKMPSSWKGWLVAITSSMVGFFAGFATIAFMRQLMA